MNQLQNPKFNAEAQRKRGAEFKIKDRVLQTYSNSTSLCASATLRLCVKNWVLQLPQLVAAGGGHNRWIVYRRDAENAELVRLSPLREEAATDSICRRFAPRGIYPSRAAGDSRLCKSRATILTDEPIAKPRWHNTETQRHRVHGVYAVHKITTAP